MKIPKRAEYGLRAMMFLTKSKKAVSVREISNAEKMPYEFLAKIFNDLEKAKLVKAKRGANGGYMLARPAEKITPGDVIVVLDQEMVQSHCAGCSMSGGCSSGQILDEIQQDLDKALNATNLARLSNK